MVIHNVPAHSSVVGIPGKVFHSSDENMPHSELEHATIPDPYGEALQSLNERMKKIEERLR